MTKNEFVDVVYENLNAQEGAKYTKKEAKKVLDVVFDSVFSTLKQGHSIAMPGVMKFQLSTVPEKSGVNPLNGEPYTKPEHTKCKVTIAANIKKELEAVSIVD